MAIVVQFELTDAEEMAFSFLLYEAMLAAHRPMKTGEFAKSLVMAIVEDDLEAHQAEVVAPN